ncbi:hypothetical protein K470DRAFT_296260 [Piedraia hortae CBS 480.64]|uniref:Uncharacterized protein n=1 Tax=Piedraia hortae CBS 480.64 TaxID=1314780 RepID=A0A6A7BTZ5_9PEZI|nr:hypothetical protein K470DRAFT_296260 [Piedraia hortae CBS 480.64]
MDNINNIPYTALAAAGGAALIGALLLSSPSALTQWLRRKNYQYEVTFALYMLSPKEKVIFNTILILTMSMFITACVFYLPDHVVNVWREIVNGSLESALPAETVETAIEASLPSETIAA